MSPLIINERNVNGALPVAVRLFNSGKHVRRISPRGLHTLEINVPVCTVFQRPLERVLFNPLRDANPFFHLFEALWILAGREDVKWIANFLPRMANYSDNGHTFHGAYGARMRNVYPASGFGGIDQLHAVVELLKRDPDTRRAVIALWQPGRDTLYDGKDMPCNCTVTFKVRDSRINMTVFNRSNDMVWGAYGANVVQFSTLLEYVAARTGYMAGTYYQWSDSFHVYEQEESWCRVRGMDLTRLDPYCYPARMYAGLGPDEVLVLKVFDYPVAPYPLVSVEDSFDDEVQHFCQRVKLYFGELGGKPYMSAQQYENTYLDNVAAPMFNAFLAHKRGDRAAALDWVQACAASDWRLAALLWLYRRYNKEK